MFDKKNLFFTLGISVLLIILLSPVVDNSICQGGLKLFMPAGSVHESKDSTLKHISVKHHHSLSGKVKFPVSLSLAEFSGPVGEHNRYGKSASAILDSNSKDLRWHFLWKSKAFSIAQRAVWQVSRFPYSDDQKNWKHAPGLVAMGLFTADSRIFNIDFKDFAPSDEKRIKTYLNRKSLITFEKALKSSLNNKKLSKRQRKSVEKLRKQSVREIRKNKTYPFISNFGKTLHVASISKQYRLRAPPVLATSLTLSKRDYYIRVALLDKGGNLAGRLSNTVVVTYGHPQSDNSHEMVDPNVGVLQIPVANPFMRISAYSAVKDPRYDWRKRFVVFKEPDSVLFKEYFKIGQKLYIDPYAKAREKSFWNQIGSAVSSAINFVADAVNWASNAYASIKKSAAVFIANRIPGVSPEFVEGLIDAGLASLGIPPTLPNFDELLDKGAGYLAETVSDYAHIPPSIAKAGIKKMIEVARESSSGNGSNSKNFEFIRLDPEFMYKPACLNIELTNPYKSATLPMELRIEDRSKIYEAMSSIVPSLNPGQKLTVPVFLRQNNDYWNYSKVGTLSQEEWEKRYNSCSTEILIKQYIPVSAKEISEALGIIYDGSPFKINCRSKTSLFFKHKANQSKK